MVKFADGQEFAEADVRAALGFKAEQDLRKSTLPASPEAYALDLPADFKAPEGIEWQWDTQNPMLQRARQEAHRLGLDQQAFSSLLGLYAADRMNTEVQLSWARQAELNKLGPAADSRLANVATWLRSQLGSDADSITTQLKVYPQAQTLRALEKLMSRFINQGSVPFDQRGRNNDAPQGTIPGYSEMGFTARRVAQMSQMLNGRGSDNKR